MRADNSIRRIAWIGCALFTGAVYGVAMRLSVHVFAPLALCLLLPACGAKGGSESGSGVVSDPDTVVVNDTMVSFGGEGFGPPEDKLKSHAALRDKLRERSHKLAEQHPGSAFDGTVTLDLGPNVTGLAALSVVNAVAFTGFPTLTLKQGTTTLQVPPAMELPALVPSPKPDLTLKAYLVFLSGGNVELRTGQCGGAYDAAPPAAVPAMVKELCGSMEDCLRQVSVRCEPGTLMSTILPVLVELRKTSAKMTLGAHAACKPGEGPAKDRRMKRMMAGELSAAELDAPRPTLPAGTKPLPSTVKEVKLTTTDGVSAADVRAAMKPKQDAFKLCYALGLAQDPHMQGQVTVVLGVGKKGAVMAVSKGGDTDLPQKDVVECILEEASTISLPGTGSAGTVSYTLGLSPK